MQIGAGRGAHKAAGEEQGVSEARKGYVRKPEREREREGGRKKKRGMRKEEEEGIGRQTVLAHSGRPQTFARARQIIRYASHRASIYLSSPERSGASFGTGDDDALEVKLCRE
ncbi:hypothetical protein Pcinc_036158 [Petrolisthes cinctipes]|uniref:Uncharacterized protein n=1 Tax=Petrolisthes cinctipes TaxID=88211 RepID=A0AAE1BV30_PETCI|nr:hypothetical protein Pcinc_036158 [Petrolisthes cinctipes]